MNINFIFSPFLVLISLNIKILEKICILYIPYLFKRSKQNLTDIVLFNNIPIYFYFLLEL